MSERSVREVPERSLAGDRLVDDPGFDTARRVGAARVSLPGSGIDPTDHAEERVVRRTGEASEELEVASGEELEEGVLGEQGWRREDDPRSLRGGPDWTTGPLAGRRASEGGP